MTAVALDLRPMTPAELAAYLPQLTQAYVRQRVDYGGEPEVEAREVAARQMAEFFPEGRPAPDHHLFTAREGSTGEVVGRLWVFLCRGTGGTCALVYDVEVPQERRGRGYGRALMEQAERWAAEQGADRMALNVFGGNAVARGLYASLGYREQAVNMGKELR